MFLKSDLLCHHHEQSLHQLLRGLGGDVCAYLSQIMVSTGGHKKQDPKLRLQMSLFVQELVRVWTALGWMHLL